MCPGSPCMPSQKVATLDTTPPPSGPTYIYLFIDLCIFIYLFFIHLSIHLYMYLKTIYLSTIFIYQCIYLSSSVSINKNFMNW